MNDVKRIILETGLVLTVVIMMTMISGAVQVANAPLLEVLTLNNVPCYQIDESGRIIDGDGRLRGWTRGDEVYNPNMELKYRLSGRHLEDVL